MLNLGTRQGTTSRTRWTSTVLSVVLTMSLALMAGSTADAAGVTSAKAASAPTATTVAHNPQGKMTSRIVGTTANGRSVTGSFIPLRFSKHNGKVKVRGLINGVIHRADGTTSTFSAMRTLRLKSINGTGVTSRSAVSPRATCDILHLVLAPLDLDLLGLQVHLSRVVLDIVAKSGAGNLLGNLLCAVTGLLDGGLGGALGRLTNLLNQILSRLGLGL